MSTNSISLNDKKTHVKLDPQGISPSSYQYHFPVLIAIYKNFLRLVFFSMKISVNSSPKQADENMKFPVFNTKFYAFFKAGFTVIFGVFCQILYIFKPPEISTNKFNVDRYRAGEQQLKFSSLLLVCTTQCTVIQNA